MKAIVIFLFFIFSSSILLSKDYITFNHFGITADYRFSDNQNSVGFGFQFQNIFFGDDNALAIKANLFGYDWMQSDPYNNNYNNSYLTNYTTLWFVVGTSIIGFVLLTSHIEKPPPYFVYTIGALWLGPSIITNSQWTYNIFQTHSYGKSFFSTTVYFNSKLDFFERNEQFFRYKPGFGLELSHIFEFETSGIGLFLDAGFDYPIDFIKSKTITNGIKPSFALKLSYGS
jgi:hypothetical protein